MRYFNVALKVDGKRLEYLVSANSHDHAEGVAEVEARRSGNIAAEISLIFVKEIKAKSQPFGQPFVTLGGVN
jgi:hypothetical protein